MKVWVCYDNMGYILCDQREIADGTDLKAFENRLQLTECRGGTIKVVDDEAIKVIRNNPAYCE